MCCSVCPCAGAGVQTTEPPAGNTVDWKATELGESRRVVRVGEHGGPGGRCSLGVFLLVIGCHILLCMVGLFLSGSKLITRDSRRLRI